MTRDSTEDERYPFEVEKLQNQVVSAKESARKSISTTIAAAKRRGVLNQILAVGAILMLSTGCGIPIGFSSILLPQLLSPNATNDPNEIPIDINMGSWIASVHSLATPFGAFLSGPMSDSLGRRNTLIISILPMVMGWCVMGLANSFYYLVIGRFICGFATGILGGPAQVYIAETTVPKLRGLLIGTPFVFYSMGILLVYALGASLHWRLVAWLGSVIPIISVFALCCVPESPPWLLRHNKQKKAMKALKMLRGHETLAAEELRDMQHRLTEEHAVTKSNENILQLCCKRSAYKPLLIVTIMSQLQMLTGTFLVIFYAADFIIEIGAQVNIKAAVIFTAVARAICTLIFCCVLMVVRRRTIVIMSSLCSGITALLLSGFMYYNVGKDLNTVEVYVVCACLLLYIFFNTPLMIIPGVMIGEMLPAKVRGRCAGYVFAMMNILLFVLAKCFPFIQHKLKLRGIFLLFSVANFLCTILMYLLQPETIGRTLDEIEDYFNGENWLWSRRDKTYKEVKQVNLPA